MYISNFIFLDLDSALLIEVIIFKFSYACYQQTHIYNAVNLSVHTFRSYGSKIYIIFRVKISC